MSALFHHVLIICVTLYIRYVVLTLVTYLTCSYFELTQKYYIGVLMKYAFRQSFTREAVYLTSVSACLMFLRGSQMTNT